MVRRIVVPAIENRRFVTSMRADSSSLGRSRAASLPSHFVHQFSVDEVLGDVPPGRPFVDGVHVARAAASEADHTRRDCRRWRRSALRCRRTGCTRALVVSGGSAVAVDLTTQKTLPETKLGSRRTHGRAAKTRRHDFRDDDAGGARASLLPLTVSHRLQQNRPHCCRPDREFVIADGATVCR